MPYAIRVMLRRELPADKGSCGRGVEIKRNTGARGAHNIWWFYEILRGERSFGLDRPGRLRPSLPMR